MRPGDYQLDHSSGYCMIPRAIGGFGPVMRDKTGRLARIWLLLNTIVRHQPAWEVCSQGEVWLEAGQCVIGEEEFGERVGMNKSAVHRGLARLVKLGLIKTEANRKGTRITINHYGEFGTVANHRRITGESQANHRRITNESEVNTNERENGRTGEREIQRAAARLDNSPMETVRDDDAAEIEASKASTSGERAVREGLARAVIGWLNGVHKGEGKMVHHRGFDPLAKDVLAAAARWRNAKLTPEEVIAVCEHRIAGWKAVTPGWLNNCTPKTLFRPAAFSAALAELRAGFEPVAMTATLRRGERPGVKSAPNEHYETKGIGECEI